MQSRLITFPDKDYWNDFVAKSSECPVLQSFEWGELKSQFGWQPIRLAIEDGGKIVAAISMLKREIPYFKHSILYAPRGPVVDFENQQVMDFLLDAIEKEIEKHNAISLKVDPAVLESNVATLAVLEKHGFEKALKQIQPRATILLDLTKESNEILTGFSEKTRYNIRLAAKKGVVIKEDLSEKGLNIFCELYQQTALRDKFLVHPVKYYQKIREIMLASGLGSNFIAYYDNKPIAGVIVFCFGSRIWYMYGASGLEERNRMPNHLLHWHVIQWAKDKGYKTYDLWGIPAQPQESHPLFGVYRFKKGFGGQVIKYIGAYDFPHSPLFYHLFEHGVKWWHNIRSLITKGKIEDSLSE